MRRKEFKVYQEETKQRFVSHWDLDYVPREQLELPIKQIAPSEPARTGDQISLAARWADWLHRLRLYFVKGDG